MNLEQDVLIVGSGVSGLYCALNLDKSLNVLVVSKSTIENNNTYLAQGGISTARNIDDIESFVEDTMKAGQYKNRVEAVQVLADESIENVGQIVEYGMPLDKENGEIDYTREGAHSVNRIVHSKDNTGEVVFKTLLKEAKTRENITLIEDAYLLDILKDGNKCIGARIFKSKKEIHVFSKIVVLATGGIGGLFKNSTNQRHLTGDGIAIALRNNIKIENLEYIQIHPTAFYEENNEGRRMLISESLRGEGAKLLNKNKERFVDELLPRDVVSKAIFEQMEKDKLPYVYLDATHLDSEYLINRFSFIYNECLDRGTDITKECIKVSPAQHYFMGGIHVDLDSKTSMENLYAVGEISCTGVHGANRLASNSLLEGLVFSKRAAKNINSVIDNVKVKFIDVPDMDIDIEQVKKENKILVIKEIERTSEDFGDELFDY
ncbi:TPA: L-aspartate oxidase [Clostridioides difficile]|uniref:L-aspartate oxidase n=1 Tax=Clostridioides difficile TaxID=1496 RepID=UPI00038C8699|nr:L-aspartate oxidase [Clostridioides difficile]AXU54166.1 L-aspartate oxidase [Clostridioides difficile]EGT3736955.1 L-aspartate oxidase [Clostridioides difficile]EGT3785308.1 L-aspartate oxidase [Clostridioides difficile]EGT3790119.1 L-aspartate oxidase [Clostridioides difficile]EGT4735410.1 L-aspartate oxidase [Clostridioides difficile]